MTVSDQMARRSHSADAADVDNDSDQAWPPRPHDPRKRVRLFEVDGWVVRAFDVGDLHAYFASHGLLHLQLWHPRARISLLTPSRVTNHKVEVFPVNGCKLRVQTLAQLSQIFKKDVGVALPSPERLAALWTWYVDRATPPQPAPPTRSLACAVRSWVAGEAKERGSERARSATSPERER